MIEIRSEDDETLGSEAFSEPYDMVNETPPLLNENQPGSATFARNGKVS